MTDEPRRWPRCAVPNDLRYHCEYRLNRQWSEQELVARTYNFNYYILCLPTTWSFDTGTMTSKIGNEGVSRLDVDVSIIACSISVLERHDIEFVEVFADKAAII
jgi:hypothetical protein